jgi:hypothetical protein
MSRDSCEVLIGLEWVKVEETEDAILDGLLNAGRSEVPMDSWISLTYDKRSAKISTRVINGVRAFQD